MSNSFCLSSPSFSASRKASDTAIIEMPRIMLLQIFAACPLPGPPACTMVLPICCRIDSGRHQLLDRRRRDIDALDLMAGLDQVLRHRQTHVAEADESDPRHDCSPYK